MLRQKKAIHAVPSACRSVPPVGSGSDRLNGPMLSRPRKPPSNTLLPSASFLLTHLHEICQLNVHRHVGGGRASKLTR